MQLTYFFVLIVPELLLALFINILLWSLGFSYYGNIFYSEFKYLKEIATHSRILETIVCKEKYGSIICFFKKYQLNESLLSVRSWARSSEYSGEQDK